MSLLHPFRKKIPVEQTTQPGHRLTNNEINELKKSIDAGQKLVQKSFTKGKAQSDDTGASNGLSTGSSKLYSINDSTGELRVKRLLRTLSKNIIVQAILRTRDSQVMKFCHPARYSNNNVGFKIEPRNPSNTGKLKPNQRKDIKRIEKFIYNTGTPDAVKPNRDKFPAFVTKLIHDHFVYDQINVERIFDPDNPSKLDHFNIVDAGTVVLDRIPRHEDDKRSFLQYTSTKKAHPIHFNEKELTFVTSHSGDINRHGYGYSEVFASLNELQFERDTESYNARFFSQGGTTRGILVIDNEDDDQASAAAMKALRQQWQSTAQGLSGAWKIPVISAKDADFVNMTQSSKDMEFERWLNYLINIICSTFQIQPDEINFPNRGGGATSKSASSSINEGSSQRNRLKQSKDKGLLPLLNLIQDFMNDEILYYYAPQYRFMFTLGDDRDEQQHEEIMQAKENNGMTVNEWRRQEGLAPLTIWDDAFSKLPGPPQSVVQELQIQETQNAQMNKDAQATSDAKHDANPNHQNTQIDIGQSQQEQQNQKQQDEHTNNATEEINNDNVSNNNN